MSNEQIINENFISNAVESVITTAGTYITENMNILKMSKLELLEKCKNVKTSKNYSIHIWKKEKFLYDIEEDTIFNKIC